MNIIEEIKYRYRKWKLKRANKSIVIRGSCRMCGECCRGVCLCLGGKWIKKEKQFAKAVKSEPQLSRFYVCGRTECGYLEFACNCLKEDGTCSDYENRPQLCRTFPSPSIFLQYGKLPDGCGFRMSTEIDFEKILNTALNQEDSLKTHRGND